MAEGTITANSELVWLAAIREIGGLRELRFPGYPLLLLGLPWKEIALDQFARTDISTSASLLSLRGDR